MLHNSLHLPSPVLHAQLPQNTTFQASPERIVFILSTDRQHTLGHTSFQQKEKNVKQRQLCRLQKSTSPEEEVDEAEYIHHICAWRKEGGGKGAG
jgi:hypothetical protein